MAVTTSQSYHRSPIHDGFATIRATRSRKVRSKVEPDNFPNVPSKQAEYFTLQRPKSSFLQNPQEVQFMDKNLITNKSMTEKAIRLSFSDPVYAKVEIPSIIEEYSYGVLNGNNETHYDYIDIKNKRNGLFFENEKLHLTAKGKNGCAKLNNGMQVYERQVLTQDSEQHSLRTDNSGSIADIRRSHSDRDNCSESSSYLTDNDRPISSYSDNSTIPSTDTEDVLKDLPSKSKFRSPQKFATLNMRRPKTIDLSNSNIKENSFYGTMQRHKMGYHSEPSTPLTNESFTIIEDNILNEVQRIPAMPLQNRNGFRRSTSETNGFTKKLQYRHSFSADSRTFPIVKRPHKCCECITGIPINGNADSPLSTKLGTLYESQDPKVGCQTILRTKPPVPWWELAIRKSKYKSCPPSNQVSFIIKISLFYLGCPSDSYLIRSQDHNYVCLYRHCLSLCFARPTWQKSRGKY